MLSYAAIASLVFYKEGRLVCKRTGKYRDTASQSSGYLVCKGTVGGIIYRDTVHRVVWFIHKGVIPAGLEVDHIDQNKHNNHIDNLRLVTRTGNCLNIGSPVGVYFDKVRNNWYASISINSKTTRLGTFNTLVDGRVAYLRAKNELLNKELR